MKTKKIFVQNWGTYQNDTLVCIGVTFEEICKYCHKKLFIAPNPEIEKTIKEGYPAQTYVNEDHSSILWMRKFKNNWQSFEILLHEIHHLVYNIFGLKGMEKEKEAQAYQFEYLFHNIRRKLTCKIK